MDITLRTALEAEKATLEARCREIERKLADLRTENEAASSRLSHVVALLREPNEAEPEALVSTAPSACGDSGAHGGDLLEMAREVLEERAPEPVHYRELANLVMQRGGSIEGSDPALTLISRLVLDDRFIRPFRRGWYALRIHYPKAKNVGRRRSISANRRPGGRGRK